MPEFLNSSLASSQVGTRTVLVPLSKQHHYGNNATSQTITSQQTLTSKSWAVQLAPNYRALRRAPPPRNPNQNQPK
jgi:hypothetical protein